MMTQTRLGTVVPILILLLSILSCYRVANDPKPTQVVDLLSMIGKSSQEITKMVGVSPNDDDGKIVLWGLPEGRLHMHFEAKEGAISYNLNSYTDIGPGRGVASPEEMAALINIDLQGRQPDEIREEGLIYRKLGVKGKTVDLYIKMSEDKRCLGAMILNFND